MSLLRLGYVLAVRRTISNWRLELVLLFGIVLAVALMSSGIIFKDLLAEAALGNSLGQATPDEANFRVGTFIGSETPHTVAGRESAYRNRAKFADQRVGSPFEPYLRDRSQILESPTFFFTGHSQLELDDDVRPRGAIQYLQGLYPERVDMIGGCWPYSGGPTCQSGFVNGELQVALDMFGAELLQLGVGDEMDIFPASAFTDPPRMRAKIVGLFQRQNPNDEYWYGTQNDFSLQNDRWTLVPMFTTEQGIIRHTVEQYPSLFLDITWFYFLDRQEIRAGDVDNIQLVSQEVKRTVSSGLTNGTITIKLDRVLGQYEDQLLPAQVPLFLILFLVTGILIYYLGLISGLVVKSRSTELAVLKSRGATAPQLGLLAFVESMLLAIPAVIVGPFLALGVVRVLGGIFFDLGGSGELAGVPVALSSQAFFLGLAGGMIAVAALTGFTLMAARQSIVEFRQAGARPPQAPFVHRYYLDILLLVLSLVLWWQARDQDSFLIRSVEDKNVVIDFITWLFASLGLLAKSNVLEIDFVLLFGKLLLLLAVGLVALRLFPMLASFSATLAEPVAPPWLVHGLRHVSRDPIIPGVMIILLMLVTALGVLGSTFSSTLERSQRDQALYESGADLLIQSNGSAPGAPPAPLEELPQLVESVQALSEVRRTRASSLNRSFNITGVTVLAVDSSNFDKVGWYRPDFADGKTLSELTELLTPPVSTRSTAGQRIMLPPDATELGLWIQPNRPEQGLAIRARLRDDQGRFFDVHLGSLGFSGWQQIGGPLVALSPAGRILRQGQRPLDIAPPFELVSLYVVSSFGSLEPGAIFLGQLSAFTPRGETRLDNFQGLERWHILEDYTNPDVSLYALETSQLDVPVGSGKSAVFSWAAGGIGLKGIRIGEPEVPVKAIVSRSLLEESDADIGDTINLSLSTHALPFEVVAVADFFPTLDPGKQAFVVVDLATFNKITNLHSPRTTGGFSEIWIDLEEGANDIVPVTDFLSEHGVRFRDVLLASELVSARVDQPLVSSGWGALLVLIFLVLALASASGVMLFSYIDTRDRQTEYALLRTLGSSTMQLNGVVWFGVGLVIAFGLGFGTWAGFQLVGEPLSLGPLEVNLLPSIGVSENAQAVVPPMILKTDWAALLVSYLVLTGVTLVTVGWLAWFSAKMEVQRALRIGDG